MNAAGRAPLRHRFEYGVYRLGRAVLASLPEAWSARLGGAIGWVAGSVLRLRRRETEAHVALAFPDQSHAWRRCVTRDSYVHLGREVAALARMTRWSPHDIASRIAFVGFDPVLEAIKRTKGVVLLTAHLGNWEMAGAGIAALGVPLDVVGKGMANRAVERDLFAIRERLGMRVIEIADAPKGVLQSLASGRVPALLWDQNAHRGGVFVPFFGRPAATHRGPALFALRTDAPVFVGFALRRAGVRASYTLEAHSLPVDRTGDPDEDARRLMSAYNRILEQAIRRAPEQYFWQHRRWKTRPGKELPSGR